MQHDTVIWKLISPGSGGFCSFRRRIKGSPTKFCKNTFNVLGICHPLACPLANSRYATVREKRGECFLLMKTIERSHSPAKQWQKIKLSKDYLTALKQIDQYLIWWPAWNIHRCKLRLTKMHQFIIRSRKLALSIQPKLVRIWKPYERQQKIRERKAELAAKISNVVKSELLERLHEGVYEGIYNFPMQEYQKLMADKGTVSDLDSEVGDESELEISDSDDIFNAAEKEIKSGKKSKKILSLKEMKEEKKRNKLKNMNIPEFVGIESDLEESEEDIEEIEKQYEYEYEYENIGGSMMKINDGNYGRIQSIRSLNHTENNKGNAYGSKRKVWNSRSNSKLKADGSRKRVRFDDNSNDNHSLRKRKQKKRKIKLG